MKLKSQQKTRNRARQDSAVVGLSFQVDGNYPHLNTRYNMRTVGLSCQMQFSASFMTTSTGAATLYSRVFALSDFAGHTQYTALFERYRITQLEVWLNPSVATSTSGSPEGGTYISGLDLDDASLPTGYAQMQRCQGAVETSIMCGHYHKWKPALAMLAYPLTTFASTEASSLWVDTDSPTTQYYALKASASQTYSEVAVTLICRATVEFQGIVIA